MKLRVFHGRQTPCEDLDDWGFEGPTIENVNSITGTYGEMYVHFDNEEQLNIAHKQTGWENFGNYALVVRFFEDLVHTIDGFYGDWELI